VPVIALIIIGYNYFFYQNLNHLGLGKFRWKETLIWGGIIALVVIVGISNLFIPILEKLLDKKVDVTAYRDLEGNKEFFRNYWWKAMSSAAIAEEIFYRGFTFYILERILKIQIPENTCGFNNSNLFRSFT